MATTNIRWTAVNRLVTVVSAHDSLTDVQVVSGWPGDELKAECIWVGDLSGDVSIPVLTAGRKQRDDQFEIPLQVRIANRATLDDTFERLIAVCAAVEDVLADDPFLDGLDGEVDAQVTNERQSVGRTVEGCIGFAEITVSVHARLL